MDSKEALKELNGVQVKIEELLLKTCGSYGDYDENITYKDTPDDRLNGNEIYKILENLEKIKDKISYLNREVKVTGRLRKNEKDYYEMVTENGTVEKVYHCGSSIEALVPDGDTYTWTISRVEHNGQDYYIYGDRTVPMEGLEVRER